MSRVVQSRGEDVRVETEGHIGWIVLDRPPVNALRTLSWQEIGAAVEKLAALDHIAVVGIRSDVTGVFSAGADVKELPMPPKQDEERQRLSRSVLDRILEAPQPYGAVIDGPALGGGCALASAADVRVGSSRASFGLPEITVGRCGGGRYLMRHLSQGAVRLLYFTGATLGADEAHRQGLLNVLCDDAERQADELWQRIATNSPIALRLAKQALNMAERLDVRTGYEVEQQFSLRLATTADAREAARAFEEKREPVWQSESS